MRIVEVGLKDFVNAEILSGLEPGEVVSLGTETELGHLDRNSDQRRTTSRRA